MDVIIVSTNSPLEEEYWEKHLKGLRGTICKPNTTIIAITEDWEGGAGNGLGTLYAYCKAQEKAKFKYRIDLFEKQKQGASVAIYHTAGQGKRLYPISASEFNNKSAVKLPCFIKEQPLTILEAVIAQTARITDKRPGRLSVFWGDQIFVPTKGYAETSTHHIEILGRGQSTPTKAEWHEGRLENYGILTYGTSGEPFLLEKIDYGTLCRLIEQQKIVKETLALSLGSFCLSPQMTFALLREFQKELETRKGKLDTDPHFWMPLTLDEKLYTELMVQKGNSANQVQHHYRRMAAFKEKFARLHSDHNFFRITDIGPSGYWWDYGSTKSYYDNVLKLTSGTLEGQALRLFFQIDQRRVNNEKNRIIIDENSCLVNCSIHAGKIHNSILVGVEADSIEARDCIIINSKFKTLIANQSLFYNVQEKKEIKFSPGTIRADLLLPKSKEHLQIYSHQSRDSKEDWTLSLPQNAFSYEQLYEKIRSEV